MASDPLKCCTSRKNLTAFGSYLCEIAPFMSDIAKSIHAEHVSNCVLRTFQWTLSEITELRTAVGAFWKDHMGKWLRNLTSGSG